MTIALPSHHTAQARTRFATLLASSFSNNHSTRVPLLSDVLALKSAIVHALSAILTPPEHSLCPAGHPSRLQSQIRSLPRPGAQLVSPS